jgi:adenosylcobinamide-GDP ribazoletransferase
MTQLTAFFMAWGMFCSLPCPFKKWDEAARPWMIVYYPVIGLLIGALWMLAARLFRLWNFTGLFAAAILTAIPYLLSGFLHLDGYLDCCDAILSRRDLAERQKILKDSHVGSFAVIGACFLFLGVFAAFGDFDFSKWRALLLIPVCSRCVTGLAVTCLRPLGTSQYAGRFRQEKKAAQTWILVAMLLAAAAGSVFFCGRAGFSALVCAACTALFVWRGVRQLGGMSGDISGFSLTLGEALGVGSLLFL